jgi:hypothetical protein
LADGDLSGVGSDVRMSSSVLTPSTPFRYPVSPSGPVAPVTRRREGKNPTSGPTERVGDAIESGDEPLPAQQSTVVFVRHLSSFSRHLSVTDSDRCMATDFG